jgi:hypothetical protein
MSMDGWSYRISKRIVEDTRIEMGIKLICSLGYEREGLGF